MFRGVLKVKDVDVVIASHGEYAAGIFSGLTYLVDANISAHVICAYCGDIQNSQDVFDKISFYVEESKKSGKEIVVFTDVYGGSIANNASLVMAENKNMHVIAGMSLTMLMEFYLSDELPLKKRLDAAITTSQEAGVYINELLNVESNDNSNIEESFF